LQKPPFESPSPVQLIAKKRDGHEHSEGEIESMISQFLAGTLTDYQMTAWLMAAYLNGLSQTEMRALTLAMLNSGRTLQLPSVSSTKVDKHSTGGVGDKISLPLAPLVAEAGLAVPMISGRGLGHTGGTLDKLEAIPGFRVNLSAKEFERVVARVGCSIMGQTTELAPADRRIYALRDVTGTVACRPLIVASILSKKLAAGLDGLVLDVKVGRGAFMKDARSARALARALVETSRALGTPARALLTAMDAPLGLTIGNALEVRESILLLQNDGPSDVTELTLELGAEMLVLGKISRTHDEAKKKLRSLLESGKPLERFAKMIEAQGGNPRVIDNLKLLPKARSTSLLYAPRAGRITEIDSLVLAEVAVQLGAGRKRAQDVIDPGVGFELLAPVGHEVSRGEPLLRVHAKSPGAVRPFESALSSAFSIGAKGPSRTRRLILGRIEG